MAPLMLVTGAGRGIGAAIARAAGAQGYRVVVNYLRSAAAADAVVADIRAAGGDALALQGDVGDPEAVERLFGQIDERCGRLDVLVNNAGILDSFRVDTLDHARVEAVFRANVFSMFHCAGQAVRRMSTAQGGAGGVILNLSSVASRLGGLAGGAAYAASKGAIDSFTLALGKEVAREGIRVVALRPGLIETDIHDVHGGLDRMRTLARDAVPMGRSGSPEEVAQTALWLASPAASYVHGCVIDVAGGR